MRIKTTFFTGMDQIDLPPTPRRGERFADLYYLTTDRAQIAAIVEPFASALGSVETHYLVSGGAKALVYRISDQEVDETNVSDSLKALLVEDMLSVELLQFYLWIIKDNAAHYDRGWISAPVLTGTVINNNVWETRHTCADGTSHSVRFDAEELRLARRTKRIPIQHINSSPTPTMLTSEVLRFQRFQYFVDIGRSSPDVAMKIAQYCSALEALVSTAQTELSHQVSERVAAVLAPPGEQRINFFKLVKEAYVYRSKAVHGAFFKPKDVERLRKCARDLDEVCRALVIEYLDTETGLKAAIEGPDQATTDFFIERTLGVSPESRFRNI
jgi:hypothetical protein